MVENLKSTPEDNKMLAVTILRLNVKHSPTNLHENRNNRDDTSLAAAIEVQCELDIGPSFVKADVGLR